MARYIELPDGSALELKKGQSPVEGMMAARQLFPELFKGEDKSKEDTKGFKAAAAAGFERLKGETALTAAKLGLKDIDEAEAYQKEKQASAARRFTPTEDSFIESPLQNVKELLGGSVPYMAAPALAGIAALTLPVSAPVVAGAGLLGAGAVSAAQFTGSNLARQMGTGKSLEETSLGTAVAGAIPQALLDTAAMALLPGIGKLFGSVGSKLTTEQAKAIASQTLTRTVADYTAKTGMAMGREGFTEAAQQVIERVQAGLEIDNPEARKEYIDSFIGGAVLGGVLAPAGRAFERGGAKRQAAAADRAEALQLSSEQLQQQKIQEEAAAQALEIERQSPEYAKSVVTQYDALQKQKQDLIAQKRKIVDASPTADADRAFNAELNQQLKAVAAEIKPLAGEYNRVQPIIQQEAERARLAGMSPEEYMMSQLGDMPTYKYSKPGTLPEVDMTGIPMPEDLTPDVTAKPLAYAARMFAMADKDMAGFPSAEDNIDYLINDPQMAMTLIRLSEDPSVKLVLPGMSKKDSKAVINDLKQAVEELKAKVAVQGQQVTEKTRTERLKTVEDEEASALEDQRQMRQAYEKEQEDRNAAIIAGIKPLTGTTAQGELFGGEQQRVNMPVAGTRVDIDAQIVDLQKQLDVARSYGAPTAIDRRSNRERVSTLLEQIRDLQDRKAKMGRAGTAKFDAKTAPLNRAETRAVEALAKNDKGELNFLSGSTMLRDSIYRLVTYAAGTEKPLSADYVVNLFKNNYTDSAKETLQYAPDRMLQNVKVPDKLKYESAALQAYIAAGTPPIKEGQTVVDWYDSLPEKPSLAVSGLPKQEREQRKAATARDAAYDRFKSGETDAKQDVVDSLVKEISLVRGRLKPETITEIEKELGALLDSSARYGNDITPQLDAVSTRWRAGVKYGTFGSAEAIPTTTTQDMLLDQMDRAYAQRQRYDTQTMSILDQIAQNYGAVTANEDRRNLIGEWLNRATTGNLNPEMTRDVQSALRTLKEGKRSETETPTRETAFGTAYGEPRTAVQQELGAEFMPEQVAPEAATRIVNGKVQYVAPEDRGPIQGSAAERYAPMQKGTTFESFAELNRYLASDYLKSARQEMGITRETVARMGLQIKEHETKIANINKQTDALKARKTTLEQSKLSEDRAAKNIIADAEVRMEGVLRRLSDELEPLRIAYMQARTQVEQLADRSEDTSRLIANNIVNFKEMDDRAVDAAQKTFKAKEELRQARSKLGSLAEKLPGIQTAQQKVITALERQRNPLLHESKQKLQELQKQLSKARVTQPRTVARLEAEIADLQNLMDTQRVNPYIPSSAFITFLNNDLRLQLDAQEETRKLDKAGKDLLNLGLQLELAATDLDVNLSKHPEIVAIKKEIGTAKEMGTDAVRELDNDLALLDNEIEKAENVRYAEVMLSRGVEQAIKDAAESRGFGAQMADVPIEPLSSAERAGIEARNKTQLEVFQASTARLQALSGQRIDFSKRREMLELIKTATKDFAELDATLKELDEGITEMQVRVELVQIKLDEATEKAASYRGPRKNLKEAKALFAQIEDFKKQIEAGNKRVETLQKSVVDYEKSRTTKQKALSEAERATSSDPEVYAEVTKLIDDRIAKLEKTISKKQEAVNKSEEAIAKLRKDIKAKKLSWSEGKATLETLKNMQKRLAEMQSSQRERRKRFNEFLKEREVLQARRSNRLGITRTDVLTGKKVEGERTKKAPAQIQEQIDAENERAAMYDYRSSELQNLEKQMTALSATPEPKTAKAKDNRFERIRALQEKINQQIDLVNEVLPPKQEKISQATRVQSAAPSKFMTGTEQSKATPGFTKQPIVESRTPAPITSEKAVADANAFAERIAAAKDKKTLDAEFKAKEFEQQNQILDAMEDNRVRLTKFINRSQDELSEIGEVLSGNPTLADRRDKLKDDIDSAQFMLDRVGDDINRLLKEQIVPYTSEDFTQLSGTEFSSVTDEDIDTTYDPRYEFSRGPTTDPSTVNTVSTELKKYFKDLSRIKIYSSVDALITANPQYKGRIPTNARGFVDTAGNKAFLIAENIDQGQALGVLLHEVGAHVGLKNILGESQYTGMVNAIKSWAKKNDGSVESVVAKAAIARVEAAKTDAKHRDDEILAYAIEEAVKAGVIPNQTKGVLGTWLSRIADGFRKLLAKFGMDLKSFDAQGLVDIAFGAAQMEMRAMPEGMSRRTFLRGAVSAVGQMYLPAVNTGLSINAKAKLFEATLDAADAWYSTVIGMAKTPALRSILKGFQFNIDNKVYAEALYNADSDIEGVESLYSQIHGRLYDEGESESSLIDLLESKPDSVEKLQMAVLDVRSQLVTAIEKLPKKENGEIAEDKLPAVGDLLFSRKAAAEPDNALIALSRQITAQPKTLKEKLSNNLALQAEMQAVDMRAGLRETLKFGDDSKFMQAMYHVRKAEQKMAQMFTVMNSGPLVAYRDSKGFVGYRSSNQNSARDVFDAIADVPVADPQLKTNISQAYMVAQRTANKGLPKLDLGALGITEEQLAAALAAADANPALKNALENVRRKYNAYNKGMIEFLASTGRITKKVAADLLKEGDYVPFYRVDKNGNASLVFNNNVKFNVGDIRRQPYLAELKGGDTKLLPLNEALQRNTLLLTDMALTNNAAKSVAYGLQALGKGKGPVDPKTGKPTDLMAIKIGLGADDAKVIRFYQEPDPNKPDDKGERHILVDTRGTAAEGIPAELVVQSLEGASLALPGFFKLGGAAADLLRAGVTRTPLYIARKLLREPMAASFTGGLDSNVFSSVFKAGAEFVRMSTGNSAMQAKLIEKGLIQSNIFAGDMSDMKKMALQLASGKDQGALDKVLAAADRYAMRADAATLALILKNAEANGLSEVEADMATMESMNFYKRGLSPTLQYASRLIPFFNAQIQGLNVLVKAARGNMPFEEQQQIKRKFFNNAMLLMGTGIVYAMAMDDDETFRNARPRDKYSNFFLPIPGVDEPLKLPIPFEAGYFFSLAVAAVDGMRAETDGKAQFQALRDLFLSSVPGYSSMGVPALVKPAFEVWFDKNFLTGGPVEPRRMQGYDTEERYLATTTELAKQMSKLLPILSPIQIEHIVRGYLGVLPLVAAAGANGLFEREGKGEKPAGRASDLPLIGTAFQKKYGGGDADVVYREAQEAVNANATFKKMLSEGRREEAVAYRDKNRVEMAMAPAAGQYRQIIGRINTDIRRTQERDDLTAEEKRLRLDALDKAKQDRADAFIRQSRAVEERLGGG